MKKIAAAVLLLILFPSLTLAAHSVVLTITDATNPVGTIYNIYRASAACSTSPTLTKIGSTSTKTYTDSSLSPGTYCYAATAVNSLGDESAQSPEAVATIPTPPNAVTITITVQ